MLDLIITATTLTATIIISTEFCQALSMCRVLCQALNMTYLIYSWQSYNGVGVLNAFLLVSELKGKTGGIIWASHPKFIDQGTESWRDSGLYGVGNHYQDPNSVLDPFCQILCTLWKSVNSILYLSEGVLLPSCLKNIISILVELCPQRSCCCFLRTGTASCSLEFWLSSWAWNVEAQVARKSQNVSDSCSQASSHLWSAGLCWHRVLFGGLLTRLMKGL